jgi:glycosyltransferase involved in cell wall biosynthesis
MEKIVSVVIPVHDPKGKQLNFLSEVLQSILSQSLYPFEVLISSSHDLIEQAEILKSFQKLLPIVIVKNKSTNAPSNLNLSIAQCSGKYIKILFQDDFLLESNYLELCVTSLDRCENRWGLITKSQDFDSDTLSILKVNIPKYSIKMLRGNNYFGSPSAVMIRRETFLPFAHEFAYLYDAEWYTRMVHNWGSPIIENSLTTMVRVHKLQATNSVKHLLADEILIAQQMHNPTVLSEILHKYFGNEVQCKCQFRL